MIDEFVKLYKSLEEYHIEDPLQELLGFIDIISKRALSQIDLASMNGKKLDFKRIAEKRKKGIPFEYILATSTFMGELLFSSPEALIPRDETELLVRTALEIVARKQAEIKDLTIIDMGTGCGNIAVSIALNSNHTKIIASDLKPETVAVAQENVDRFHLHERITLFQGDLFNPLNSNGLKGNIDMVVCNPPYIPTSSLSKMPETIIKNEPIEAFDAGPFGINIFKRLINEAPIYLKSGGILLFEIGAGQEKLVTRLFNNKQEYAEIEYYRDENSQIRAMGAVRR